MSQEDFSNIVSVLQQGLSDKTLILQLLTNLSVDQKLTFNKLLEIQSQNLNLLNEILKKLER